MSDQVAGTVLMERYALEDRIGVGGMASVYRAIDLTTGSRVAVKILSREFLSKNAKEADRNVKRFRREAEILRLLAGDPYVVQFIEHGVSPAGDHFIAMELLEGEQLRFYIGRGNTAMGLRTFAYYAKHLIHGLIGIHHKNVIHRDLAPDNIVIVKTREGLPWPKFLDFGIGKSLEGDQDQLTQMLTIMGKPQYFSPEQARGHELTARSDVYALGVVLYEMITGYVPLEIHGIVDLRKIQKDAPVPISNYREGCRVPEDLRNVIMQCLEKDAERRPVLDDVLAIVTRFSDRLDAGEEFPLPASASGLDPTTKIRTPSDSGTLQAIAPTPGGPTGEFGAGDKIGRFEVRERIGRGGMGLVYLAWDPILQREVAIKVATRVEEEKARRAILREARASSHLKSENIVTIYDAGTEAGSPYIAMEYVRGKTLAQIIDEEGPLSGDRFARLARGILDGLIYAHEGEEPVIHRDLKPANILCAGEVAKITDFGIATVTAAQHLTLSARDSSRTGPTGTEGSVFTMSPEQANNKSADHRSDIYSLGCVLYMMATGRAPFQGNQIAILYQHVTRAPEPPIKVNPDLAPAGLNAVILKCLEKDPASRYQSAREVKSDLERLFGATRAVRPWHRSPLVLFSLAAIAIAGVAIAFALFGRKGPASTRIFTLAQVAGIPVQPDRPEGGYVTRARYLDLEVAAQSAGDLRATVAADWLDPPVTHTFPLAAGQTTAVRVPLPDASGLEPAKFTVTLDRPDNPALAPTALAVWQDLEEPRVRFSAYGVSHETSTNPLRVLRIDDVAAVVDDLGGFDDEGLIPHLVVRWNENQHGVAFTRKRKEGEAGLVWTATVNARDRADNRRNVVQLVEVVGLDVVARRPPDGSATSSRTVRVEIVARLSDRTRPIEGLDENDLDLGDHAFAARLVVGSRPMSPVPMKRVVGGYSADLEIPPDAPSEIECELEVRFEGDEELRLRHRFDAIPPIVTVTGGGSTVSSTAKYSEPPRIYVDARGSRNDEISCRIEDGAGGIAGATVDVRIGQGLPERVEVAADGTFSLPPLGAEESTIRIEGRDQAGNLAPLEISVIRKGLQVASVTIGGHEPDSEGRVFVKDDKVELRLAAIGVTESEHAFAVVLDERGREQESVKLERVAEEPQRFEAREIRLFPEGADSVVRKLRILFGATAAEARSYSRDLTVVNDREAPAISVTFEGSSEEVRGTRTVGRFPTLRVRISDNVALVERSAAKLVSWTRADASAPDAVVDASAAAASAPSSGATEVTFTIDHPPGPTLANRFDFTIEARDRAGREAVREFAIVVVPSDVAIISVADQAGFAEFGRSADHPLLLNKDTVLVAVRPPRPSAIACALVVKAYPDSGTEIVRRFALDAEEGTQRIDFVVPLPRASDGRLIQRGRMVFLLEEAGSTRPDELSTVYYLLDRDHPSWEVSRNGRTLSEAERSDWIKVAALSSVRIGVADGRGAGFDDFSIEDPGKAIGGFEERTHDRITFSLRDDESFRGAAMREVELSVRDAAGNVTAIHLKLARSRELLEVKRLLTPDGREPIVSGERIVVAKPALRFVIDHEAVGYWSVRWVVKRGDREINSGLVELKEGQAPEPELVEWQAAERAEPYSIEFYAEGSKGFEREPFHKVKVLVDTVPPLVYLRVGDQPIGKGERATIKDFDDLRLDIEDVGADLGPNPARVEVLGAGGQRLTASVAASRDGTMRRILPPAPLPEGLYTIQVRAEDRLGNSDTRSFDVEVSGFAGPSTRVRTTTRPSTRATTRPDPASDRTVANHAIREKDEQRTGIKLAPVWDTPDRSRPPRFFMSQTEVSNEQFLRFVDVLLKDQIPRELRWHSDLSATRKKVELMRSRFDDFRRDPSLPVVDVDAEVALAFAAWTGGRLPSREEWVGAAGRFLLKDAKYPVYLDHGTPKSNDYWMREPRFAVFQRGTKDARRQHVTELLRDQASAPFGIVGLAGNVAEWVTFEPGGRRVAGTMGGSFKYPYTNEVNNPRLDREPRMSPSDAGIRVLWPAQARSP